MSDLEKAVESTLEAEERAIFLEAVSSLPDKSKKAAGKNGGKKVTRKDKEAAGLKPEKKAKFEPVSDDPELAGKPFGQKWAVSEKVAEATGLEPAPLSELDAVFSNLETELLGDKAKDLAEMTSLRDQGFALINKSKGFNLRDLEYKAKRDAWGWREEQPKEAARMIFNEITSKGDARSEVMKLAFLELQDAYHQSGGDPMKKQKYSDLCLKIVLANPRMLALHEANLKRADEVMAAFEAQKADQERLYTEGVELLELANIIAEGNGWPITQKKADHKGGGSNGAK